MTNQPSITADTEQAPTESAKSMLLTVLGELVLPADGALWTGTAIAVMSELGFSSGNTRQALARLSESDVLAPHRHGRQTRWELTAAGRQLLGHGAKRIYHFGLPRSSWNHRWLLVMCSIPEKQREKRRRLHAQLSFAGFGFLSPTLAISPHTSAESTAASILQSLDLDHSAVVLTAEATSSTHSAELLDRSWDLTELAAGYHHFIATFSDMAPTRPNHVTGAVIRLVHAWRKFPFSDPELPSELLPTNWVGHQALTVFQQKRQAWAEPARSWFESLERTHHP